MVIPTKATERSAAPRWSAGAIHQIEVVRSNPDGSQVFLRDVARIDRDEATVEQDAAAIFGHEGRDHSVPGTDPVRRADPRVLVRRGGWSVAHREARPRVDQDAGSSSRPA